MQVCAFSCLYVRRSRGYCADCRFWVSGEGGADGIFGDVERRGGAGW